MNLNFPLFWILIPLAIGLFYGYFFYGFPSSLPLNLRRVLFAIRSLLVFGLGLMILEPSMHWIREIEEKPEILILQDNSESILLGHSPAFYPSKYASEIKSIARTLSKKFDVYSYSFGHGYKEGLPLNFTDKETDFSELSGMLKDRYEGKNIGAIILATDGLFNKGSFPVESLLKLHAPVYCLGLGDTSRQKDAILNQVDFNEVVFAGDRFPIQTFLTGLNLNGEKLVVNLTSGNKILQSKTWKINGNNAHQTINFELGTSVEGNYTYKVEIQPLPGELTLKNNWKILHIQVLRSKQNILLLTGISHPDIGALKQALTLSRNNFLIVHNIKDKDPGDMEKYSCIILYQLPLSSGGNLSPWLQKKIANLPVFNIYGLQTGNLREVYPQLSTGYNESKNPSISQANSINTSFRLFSYSDSLKDLVAKLPPLEGPYLVSKGNDPSLVFINSKSFPSENLSPHPILYFENNSGKKSATLLGEGLWRWRAFEYAESGSHHLVDDFLQKIVSYLTVQEDKSRLRILMAKSIWSEYEPIQMEAQLYNSAFELTNKPVMSIDLVDDRGKFFHFLFSPNGNQYYLNLGILPVNNYHYTIKAEGIDPKDWKKGTITVESSLAEFTLTQANHSILYQISQETSGELFTSEKMDKMLQEIEENKSIKTSIHETREDLPWIHIPYILMAFIFLLSLEWVLRKWNGVY